MKPAWIGVQSMKSEKKGSQKKARRGDSSPEGGGSPFDDFLEDFATDPDQPLKFLRAFMAGEEAYNPAVDVIEEKEQLLLIADLPGVPEKDLQLEFIEGGVVLRGRRAPAPEARGSKLRRAERPAGEFSKSVPLPRGLDVQNATLRIEHGVLTLTIPRLETKGDSGTTGSHKVLKAGERK